MEIQHKMKIETIDYSVCVDCLVYIVYGEIGHENETAESMQAHVAREVGGKDAHFCCGDCENDEEFSTHSCDLCCSSLAGARHHVVLVIREKK